MSCQSFVTTTRNLDCDLPSIRLYEEAKNGGLPQFVLTYLERNP